MTMIEAQRFREVLGNFPTGVVVVSSIAADGEPVGMVVGSFTSVSLDPPLVAYLPSVSSKSYARLRESGSFCVSVLSADQEAVCRRFAGQDPDKFAGQSWTRAPSGNPILDGAVAWIDCEVVASHPAGDHDIVVGAVTALDAGAKGGPLLFFQGGYGGFDPRALAAPFRPDLRAQLQLADVARGHLETLAARSELECYAQSVAGEDLVITAACGSPGHSVQTHLGRRLPLAPPFGAVFAAYDRGIAALRLRNGALEPGSAAAAAEEVRLERVRERGWSIGLLAEDHDAAWRDISLHGEVPASPGVRKRIDEALQRLDRAYEPEDADLRGDDLHVRIIAAPVRDAAGSVVQAVTMFGFPESADSATVQGWISEVVGTADAVTHDLIAASMP